MAEPWSKPSTDETPIFLMLAPPCPELTPQVEQWEASTPARTDDVGTRPLRKCSAKTGAEINNGSNEERKNALLELKAENIIKTTTTKKNRPLLLVSKFAYSMRHTHSQSVKSCHLFD